MTGFGLGWVNVAADYSRYLPRNASSGGVVGWTTFGASIAPVVLLVFGLLLAGSSPELSTAIGQDPIGALAATLPTWFLVPFALVAVLGPGRRRGARHLLVRPRAAHARAAHPALVGRARRRRDHGARHDLRRLLRRRLPRARSRASSTRSACPVAAWAGVMLADVALRRRDYAERRALRPGRPLRRRPLVGGRARRRGHGARLGAGDQHATPSCAHLAGLPARAVRAGRPRGRLGVRQPGRARGAGRRVRRDAAARSARASGAQEAA